MSRNNSDLVNGLKQLIGNIKPVADQRIISLFDKIDRSKKQQLKALTKKSSTFNVFMPGSGMAYGLPQCVRELYKLLGDNRSVEVTLVDPDPIGCQIVLEYVVPQWIKNYPHLHIVVAQMNISQFFIKNPKYTFDMLFLEHPSTSYHKHAAGLWHEIPRHVWQSVPEGKQIAVLSVCYKFKELCFLKIMHNAVGSVQKIASQAILGPESGLPERSAYQYMELSVITRGLRNMIEFSNEVAHHDATYQLWPSRLLLLMLIFNSVAAVYDFAEDGVDVLALIMSLVGIINYFKMIDYETFIPDRLLSFFMCVGIGMTCAVVGAVEPASTAYLSLFRAAEGDDNTSTIENSLVPEL